MGSFSYLGLILSCVFGVIIIGLVAELCYFLWWKKSLNSPEIEELKDNNFTTELFSFLFCCKKPISAVNPNNNFELNSTIQPNPNGHKHEGEDLELGNSRETLLKEESVESELIRLHNLCGPPRFLFTIKEETREELESEDAASKKCSKTRSLSDIVNAEAFEFDHHGFNPLFESFTEEDLRTLRSSPPSKFKFLRDAEEKLIQHLVEEAEKRVLKNGDSFQDSLEDKDCSFTFLNLNR